MSFQDCIIIYLLSQCQWSYGIISVLEQKSKRLQSQHGSILAAVFFGLDHLKSLTPYKYSLLSFRIMFLSFNYHPCSEGCIVSTCVRLYVCLCLSVNTITSEPLEIWSQNFQAIILCSKGRTVGQV